MVGRWEGIAVLEGVVCNGCILDGKLLRMRAFLKGRSELRKFRNAPDEMKGCRMLGDL